MDRNDVDWKGYWASCPTPFRASDESLDLDALRRLLEFYVSCGLHGVLINGTVGEWFSQIREERKAVAETAVDQVAGRMTVVIGCTAYTAGRSPATDGMRCRLEPTASRQCAALLQAVSRRARAATTRTSARRSTRR